MLLEIGSWAILFTVASFTLPYVIPYYRNKLKQIKSTPVAVFDSSCIRDVQQAHIDTIDRSIGQIVNTAGQLLVTGWACLNLAGLHAYLSLDALMLGFYIYDTYHILTKPYAKSNQPFVIHHGLTILLIVYLYILDFPYNTLMNIIYILLEFSAAAINISNLLIHTYPSSRIGISCSFINLSIYIITRIVIYPIILVYTTHYAYVITTTTYMFYLCFPPLIILYLLFGTCIYWCSGMIAKHRALKQKLIL